MKVTNLSGPGLGAVECNGSTTFVTPSDALASPCSLLFLGKFQGLQRSINNYIEKHSLRVPKLNVDGDIGLVTLAAAREVWTDGFNKGQNSWPDSPPSSTAFLASNVDQYSASYANAVGRSVDTTADTAAQVIVGQGTITPLPGQPRKAGLGGPLALAALAGFAVYKIAGRKKRG